MGQLMGGRAKADLRHRVGLVQDEELEGRARIPGCRLPDGGRCEGFDLVADHVDATLVTGIQLHRPHLHQLRPGISKAMGVGSWMACSPQLRSPSRLSVQLLASPWVNREYGYAPGLTRRVAEQWRALSTSFLCLAAHRTEDAAPACSLLSHMQHAGEHSKVYCSSAPGTCITAQSSQAYVGRLQCSLERGDHLCLAGDLIDVARSVLVNLRSMVGGWVLVRTGVSLPDVTFFYMAERTQGWRSIACVASLPACSQRWLRTAAMARQLGSVLIGQIDMQSACHDVDLTQ